MIEPRKETFSINYADEQLHDLFVAQNQDLTAPRHLGQWFGITTPFPYQELIEGADRTLMIATRHLNDQALINSLQERADAGVRIYLLLGSDSENQQAIEALAGRCLIRTGIAQNGTLIIRNQATDTALGIILSANVADSNYWLTLTQNQCEDYFRIFCHLFWEESRVEHLEQGHKGRKAVASPLGKIDLNHQDPLAEKLTQNLLRGWSSMDRASLSGIFSQIDLDALPLASSGTLISELSQMNSERAIKLSDKVAHLVLTEQIRLPQIVLGEENTQWVLPQTPKAQDINWCVRLTQAQSNELSTMVKLWQQQGRWHYHSQLRLADVNTPIRFTDDLDQEREVQLKRTIKLDPVRSSNFDQFLNADVRDLVAHQIRIQRNRLAHTVDYHVDMHPPYCPDKAIPDRLHKEWQSIQDSWIDHLTTLSHLLTQEDSTNNTIEKRLRDALGRFFATLSHSRRSLQHELTQLGKWDCMFASPSMREEKLVLLNKIADQVDQRPKQLLTKIDETKQQQAWEKQKLRLLENLKAARIALKKSQEVAKEHRLQAPALQDNLNQRFKQQWHSWIDDAEAKKNGKNNWDSNVLLNYDMGQAVNWINRNLKQLSGDLKRTARLLSDDLSRAKQKIARDSKEREKQQEQNNREVERLTRELKNHGDQFIYKPSSDAAKDLAKLLGNRSQAKSNQLELKWPSEELPQFGTCLRNKNNQRYLVINCKSQLAVAELDAQRLNATICTERKHHG